MNKPRVFVQIYTFYPIFGQKEVDFCPNLYFLAHIWTKTKDTKQKGKAIMLLIPRIVVLLQPKDNKKVYCI